MPFSILFGVAALFIFLMSKAQGKTISSGASIAVDPFNKGDNVDDSKRVVPYQDLFMKWGEEFGVQWQLIAAHASVESSFNAKAFNKEGSSGLMQILLPLTKNKGALRQFEAGNIPEWSNLDKKRIFDPDYNIMLGASLIRANIASYGIDAGISKYNSDTAGNYAPFKNQHYVDAVKAKYEQLLEQTNGES